MQIELGFYIKVIMLKIVILTCLSGIFLQTAFSANAKDGIECNLWDTKYFPHEICSKFYVCDNGHLAELECPSTLYFNPRLEVCDYPINVPECVGGTREPEYTPPSSPTSSITTTETPGTTSTEPTLSTSASTTAPPSTSTSTAATTTSTSTPLPTTSTSTEQPTTTISLSSPPINSTPPIPNNCPPSGIDKIPHPSNCTRYIVCVDGVPHEVLCATGLHFNPATKECDFPENANCQSSPEPPSTPPPSFVPECPSEGVSFLPLPDNCTFYVLCADGFPLIQKCANGTCFNPEQSKCEIPADFDAQQSLESLDMDVESICQDNKGEVELHPSRGNCIEYHICFGKTYKGRHECRRDTHFNYFTQNCIPKGQSFCNAND